MTRLKQTCGTCLGNSAFLAAIETAPRTGTDRPLPSEEPAIKSEGRGISEESSGISESEESDVDDDTPIQRLLQRLSGPDMKYLINTLLRDSTQGRMSDLVEAKLLTQADASIAHNEAEAEKLLQDTKTAAVNASSALYKEAVAEAPKHNSAHEHWANAMNRYLPRVRKLLRYGPTANGAERAWDLLMVLAAEAIQKPDGGEVPEIYGDEYDCDDFHDEVDDHMLRICKAQLKCGKIEWLKDSRRREEIKDLHKQAGEMHYRYQRTFKLLIEFQPRRRPLTRKEKLELKEKLKSGGGGGGE